jgi:Tol biopolymer transport system component
MKQQVSEGVTCLLPHVTIVRSGRLHVSKGGLRDRRSIYASRTARAPRVGGLLALLIAVAAFAGAATAAPGVTELVSVRSNGRQGNDISGRFSPPAVSADGRVVAFDSVATNLVGGDTNGVDDIFVRDRSSGRTERVSVDSRGRQANGGSFFPAVSGDGRLVAFQSVATNLVAGDTNGVQDVFVHDRLTGVTTRASVASHSGRQADGASNNAAISADGRFVAFVSGASNLVPRGVPGVYVRDLLRGTTELVSVSSAGVPANGFTASPNISADGRFVTFASFASNLVPGDTNGTFDVFVHDRQGGTTVRASVDSAGVEGNGSSLNPSISADGRLVAFASDATNLVPGDTNDRRDAFVHDLLTGATERVSVDSAGNQANNQSIGPGIRGGPTFGPKISGDGRFVVFDSIATNLVPGDTNTCALRSIYSFLVPGQCPDVFVHDRQAGTTVRVSVDSAGAQSNGPSTDPAINTDGSVVAFFSAATNLVPDDANTCGFFTSPGQCPDIFVHVG